MSSTIICHCKDCELLTVPGTQESGYPVDRRTWHKHQNASNQAETVGRARAALEARDDILVAAMSSLSTSSNTPNPTGSRRNKVMDQKLKIIGDLQDQITTCHRKLDKLLTPLPSTGPGLMALSKKLQALVLEGVQIETNLRLARKRRHQFSAVKTLYEATEHDLVTYQKALTLAEKHVKRAQQENLAERVRQESDPSYLNTGASVDSQITSHDNSLWCDESDHHFESKLGNIDPILQLWMFMAVACNVSAGMSQNGCRFLLWMTHYIVQTCFLAFTESLDHLPDLFRHMLTTEWPRDVRTARSTFQLDAKETIYAVCPEHTCHMTYAPKSTLTPSGIAIPTYPEYCNAIANKKTGAKCGGKLCRDKKIGNVIAQVPIKPYIVFDFKDWLAGILARPGYETMMDESWSQMKMEDDGRIRSIFQGEILQEFKGPDGRHFSDGGGEGRYVFSLYGDWFNPLSNKLAGKRISCGVMMLACQNIPPHLRHLPENVFIFSIMPGPSEPKYVVNTYLQPLVEVFLLFWDIGVRFSRTFNHRQGRCVMCALVCVVCDLPAARKFGGFSSCTHTFYCAVCLCRLPGSSAPHNPELATDNPELATDNPELATDTCPACDCIKPEHAFGCWNIAEWERRTRYGTLAMAHTYLASPDEATAQSAFDQSGLRYTELLRLPYFDLSRFVVVDSMHNLFLGLLKEHFTNILGYDSKCKGDDDRLYWIIPSAIEPTDDNPFPIKEGEVTSIKKLLAMLQRPFGDRTPDEWISHYRGYHLEALKYVCHGLHLSLEPLNSKKPTRANYANILVTWVSAQFQG